MDKNNLNLA